MQRSCNWIIIHLPHTPSTTSVTISLGKKLRVCSLICVTAWNTLTSRPTSRLGTTSTENQQNHYFNAAGDNVGGDVYGQHNQPSPSPRMLVVSVPMVSDQPSISTNSISLKGSETISGDSIIIPIAINTLATIRSITRNGM